MVVQKTESTNFNDACHQHIRHSSWTGTEIQIPANLNRLEKSLVEPIEESSNHPNDKDLINTYLVKAQFMLNRKSCVHCYTVIAKLEIT